MSILSKRLTMLFDMIPACDTFADVGCDHAYLSISAVKSEKCKIAFAMDVRQGPLDKAKANITEAGLDDKIYTVLSDGLTNAPDTVLDTILISGMGGILIDNILEQGKLHLSSNKCLILQPQSDYHLVRRRLNSLGYVIKDEKSVVDAGKFYFAIYAEPGKVCEYDEEFMYHFGKILLDCKDSVLIDYIKYRLEKSQERLAIAGQNGGLEHCEGITEEIKLCNAALAYMGI